MIVESQTQNFACHTDSDSVSLSSSSEEPAKNQGDGTNKSARDVTNKSFKDIELAKLEHKNIFLTTFTDNCEEFNLMSPKTSKIISSIDNQEINFSENTKQRKSIFKSMKKKTQKEEEFEDPKSPIMKISKVNLDENLEENSMKVFKRRGTIKTTPFLEHTANNNNKEKVNFESKSDLKYDTQLFLYEFENSGNFSNYFTKNNVEIILSKMKIGEKKRSFKRVHQKILKNKIS